MRTRLLSLLLAAATLAAALAWFAAGTPGRAADDQGTLAGILSWALSTPENRVSVGAVEGALSSKATIRDLKISDKNGVWLTLDRASISWSRTALFARRLEIDSLVVDRLDIARRPVADEEDKAKAADAPALPELPVKVVVSDFDLKELVLGQGVVGPAARIAAKGSASLGKPSEGLSLKITANRLDAAGTFAVNLGYVPSTQQFDLAVKLDEPAGGLLSTIAGLPGTPPIRLDLQGSGPLDKWASTLVFESGPTVGANGHANLTREGDIRVLGLDLTARIEGLLPPYAAPVFAGTTTLTGGVVFGDDGGFAIRNIDLASRTARLTASGYLNAQRQIDLALAVRAVPTDGSATRAGSTTVQRLLLDARATGSLDAPRVAATLDAAGIEAPAGRLGAAKGTFTVDAFPGSETLSRLALDLQASGLAPADPALARATGDTLSVTARGTLGSDLVLDAQQAELRTKTADLSWTGRVGRRVLRGTAQTTLPDLSAFSGLAGRDLGGAASLKADIDGDPARYRLRAALDGAVTDARVAIAQLDNLLAGRVAVSGTLERLPSGFGFQGFRVAGPNLSLQLDGPATSESANLQALLDIPDLKRADERLSGRAHGQARVTGSLDRPDAAGDVTLADATSMGRAIPQLRVGFDAKNVTGNLDAQIQVTGRSGKDPVAGKAHVTRSGGAFGVDGLDLAVGTARLSGDVRVAPGPLASGALALTAPDLDVLTPFALTPLAGDIDARLTLASTDGRQDVDLTAKGNRIAVAGQSLRKLDATASLRDLWNRPSVTAAIGVDQAVLGGQTFQTIRLDSKGSADASDFSAKAKGLGLDFETKGRLRPGPPIAVDIASLTASKGKQRLALARPTTIVVDKGTVTLSGLEVLAGSGRITANGSAGSSLDLTVEAKAVPLAVSALFAPDLGLEGTLDARASLRGPAQAPAGEYRVSVARLTAKPTREAAIPAIDVKASGRLADGRATVDATLTAAKAGTLAITGSVPLAATGSLDVKVRGPLDVGVLNTFIAAQGRQVTGRLAIDVSATGPVRKPVLAGTATLAGGSFTDALQGIRLQNIAARIAAKGDVVTIEQFRGGTPNGGTLDVAGRVTVDPNAGFPADIRLTGRNAQLLDTPFVDATANLDITLSGPLARAPRIGGKVDLISMNVNIAQRLPVRLEPLPNTKHIRPGPAAEARLKLARQQAQARRSSPFVATFDLAIDARNRIFARGRGLEAELGGSLRLTGTSRDPVAVGAFDLRRGEINLAGQRINLVKGKIAFTGDFKPSIDFVAQTQAADVTAQIAVTGTASDPAFAISSQPPLPQDEVISRILFGRATGGLTGFQALQLAETVAELSGGGGGFEGIRKALGVDSLDVSQGSSGGPALGLARNLGRKLRIGVSAGATAADTGLQADYDVNRHVKLRAQVGADGSAAGGVTTEWEY